MGERKGVNKYYPPDWDPSKGSINNYVGQHPLRDRARKLGQGILIIRFEMPYNIWCGGCNSHIGMGVRYNAEKSKAGMYYTTPIYKFRMKCHLCNNHFEIQTDPKNHDYVILEGARRKEQRWDPTENGQIATEDKAVQKKMVTDAMFKLEHGSDDIQKGKKAKSNIGSLEMRRDEWKDDYMLNKLARQKFRDEKKAIKAEVDGDNALLLKSSLDIPLQKESEDDVKLAGLIKYRALESYDERQAEKRKEIESRPLFDTGNKSARIEVTSPNDKKLDIIKKHLRTAKANNHSSPFDRTKMNTLGTTISKQSLGIRKKSLPKFTSPVQNLCDIKDKFSKSGNDTDTETDGYSDDRITDNIKPLHDNTAECEMMGDISHSCVNIEQGDKYSSCNVCNKSVRECEDELPEDTTSVYCDCKDKEEISTVQSNCVTKSETEESSIKQITYHDIQLTSSCNSREIKCDNNNSSSEGNFKISALGLVCDYSDTDSDS